MLEVIGNGPAPGEVIVMAGPDRSAPWYDDVQAHPATEVAIGRHRFRPVARILKEDEALTVLADYEQRHRWMAPAIRRILTHLAGWDYDSNDHAQRRLLHQFPLMAFRPHTTT